MVVTTTQNLLIDATSPSEERIIAWKDKQGLINVMTLNPHSELSVTIVAYGSIESMVEVMGFAQSFHSWLLQGIKSKELETAIQKYL